MIPMPYLSRRAPPAVVALFAAPLAVGALGGCASLPSLPELEIPDNDPAFRTRVYAGATMGNAHLNPDTSGTVFTVDNKDALATQLRLGVDVHNMLALELDTSVLGTATLREAGTDVKYSAATLSALVYGLGGVQMRSRREGWSAYGRLGYGVLKKSSAVVALEEGGSAPVIGAGLEYGFANGLGIRGEITRFDADAVYTGFGAVYRFGLTPREVGGLLAEVAEPVLASGETRVAAGGRSLDRPGRFGRAEGMQSAPVRATRSSGSAGPTGRRRTLADDRDRDGVRDALDRCPDTNAEVTVDRVGCGLFDAVLGDVVFASGSHWLTPRARGELDALAERLLAFPEVRVRVSAHTDSSGAADANLALSARRAEGVVQYLQSRGVAELQLEARGLGETRPLAGNDDAAGRERNRRVEIETLGNLSAGLIARSSSAGASDSDEPPRWLPPPAPAAPPSKAAGKAPAERAWKATFEPALGAARASEGRSSELRTGRPEPLPRPGYVPGLTIAGVLEGLGFVTGSAELRPGSAAVLERVATELAEHPSARVALMAHTDDRGEAAENLALSERRADAVLERLAALGIERGRMVAEGYGETLPLVQNVTAEDRARNRRIEIRVLR